MIVIQQTYAQKNRISDLQKSRPDDNQASGGVSMSLRFSRAEDKKSIQDMMDYCFQDYNLPTPQTLPPEPEMKEPESEEIRKEKEEALRWVLVKEDANGKIGQHVAIVPLTIHFDGETIPMAGIGGVASLPEYRYGGGVMELLRMSLQVMHERGYAFSELGPFSFEFYRKCGWEWGFRWHELKIPMKELTMFKGDKGVFVPLAEEHKEQAMSIRNLHGSRFNGAEWMDASKMKDPFPPKDRLGYGVLGEDGRLSGYVLYRLKNNAIQCRHFFYRDITAKRQLLHFFHRHNSQVEFLQLTVPETDTIQHLLGNQYLEVKADPGMMVRVVDVAQGLASMKVQADLAGSFVMQVSDETAPWNQGNWHVTAFGGHLRTERIIDREPDCVLSIQRLSQLVYGFLSGQDVTDGGMCEWRTEAVQPIFHKVFQKRPTAQWIPF